jgi:hypothetical protein
MNDGKIVDDNPLGSDELGRIISHESSLLLQQQKAGQIFSELKVIDPNGTGDVVYSVMVVGKCKQSEEAKALGFGFFDIQPMIQYSTFTPVSGEEKTAETVMSALTKSFGDPLHLDVESSSDSLDYGIPIIGLGLQDLDGLFPQQGDIIVLRLNRNKRILHSVIVTPDENDFNVHQFTLEEKQQQRKEETFGVIFSRSGVILVHDENGLPFDSDKLKNVIGHHCLYYRDERWLPFKDRAGRKDTIPGDDSVPVEGEIEEIIPAHEQNGSEVPVLLIKLIKPFDAHQETIQYIALTHDSEKYFQILD